MTVRQNGAAAIAQYQLSAPVRQFTFHEILTTDGGYGAPTSDLLRDSSWGMSSDAFYLRAGTVQRYDGAPFDNFEVLINPDSSTYGRVYPALVPLGDGVVIGLEYLAGARAQMATVIRLLADDGQIVLAGGQPAALDLEVVLAQGLNGTASTADEYVVFIGPQDYLVDGAVRAVIDPAMPLWVVDTVLNEAVESARFYEEKFGGAARETPTFLLSYINRGYRAHWRGDVSAGGLIAMRLTGAGWARETAQLDEELSLFVAHEVNHLWNGRLYQHAGGDLNAWLHEGAAEYLAVKSLHARGRISDARFDQLMMRHVNRCIQELGYRFYNGETGGGAIKGSAIYDCGATIQWFAEAALTKSGGDSFSLWNTLFAKSVMNGSFGAHDFFNQLEVTEGGQRAIEAIRLLTNASPATEYTTLEPLLLPLGIRLRDAPELLTTRRFIGRLLVPLLRQHCVPPHDFSIRWTGTRYVIDLFTEGRCSGAFEENLTLTQVEGFDLFDQASGAYDAAAAKCLGGEELVFATQGEGSISFQCTSPLPPRPRQLALTAPWAINQPF